MQGPGCWAALTLTVGDSAAYVYRASKGTVQELTHASHENCVRWAQACSHVNCVAWAQACSHENCVAWAQACSHVNCVAWAHPCLACELCRVGPGLQGEAKAWLPARSQG